MCLLHPQPQEPHVYSRTFQGRVYSTGQPWEVGASLQVCKEIEALGGSTGMSRLLGGCGPPVRHRCSQGHPATPSSSDMQRALDFL